MKTINKNTLITFLKDNNYTPDVSSTITLNGEIIPVTVYAKNGDKNRIINVPTKEQNYSLEQLEKVLCNQEIFFQFKDYYTNN